VRASPPCSLPVCTIVDRTFQADPGIVVEAIIDGQLKAREHVTSDEIGALIEAAKGNRYGRPRRHNDPPGIPERASATAWFAHMIERAAAHAGLELKALLGHAA
jgi:hypothetical protein